MKKQFGLPLMLASALAFSACSSDDVAENGPKDIAALTNGGYLKMSINLPSRAANGGFRTTDQTGVTLEDGLAKEYNVKDAILVLFEGVAGNEGEAVFHSAYDITTSMQLEGTTTDQITSTTKLVKKVNKGGDANKVDPANTLYALVILNNNGLFEVTPTNALNIKSVTKASDAMPTDGTSFTGKFSEFQALKATADKSFYTDDKTGILMMNAPLYETTGGTAKPTNLTTLAEVTNNVYNTAMEAQNNPGAEIFVERAVAKVTMASSIDDPVLSGDEYKTTNSLTASLYSWGLDYTNNISYLIHNAAPTTNPWVGHNAMGDDATNTNYRFGGNTAVKGTKGFRAYWGIDPNYDATDGKAATYGTKNFVRITDAGLTIAMDEKNPLYCMENTFNVKNMNEDQTTRAIVKVKLTPTHGSTITVDDPDGSFYIVNGNKSQIFDEAKLKTFIFENFVKKCNTVYKASLTPKGDPTKADITFTTLDGNSEMSVDKLVVTYTDHSVETYDNTSTAVAEVNAALKKITKYVGGYAYYPIRIKHFGNDLTPWDATKHTQNDRYNSNNENKFLGRYGVLRNNWYDLGINSISGIGSPVIPNAPGSPDDELESFISVRINVLSWAKRTQREDL